MTDRTADLVAETRALLAPGERDLVGAIVDTRLTGEQDIEMMAATVELGDLIAERLADGPAYVYSGNDDSRFASNVHQGLTIADDAFVWECQQLLVGGTFVLVFYFAAPGCLDAIIDDIEGAGYRATGVRPEP